MQDARISTGLPGHPKTKKLAKRIGVAGCWHLVCLFLWTAANRSDGSLTGMTDEDLELAADWSGDDGTFVAALKAVGFLDGADGAYAIHDWADHNPWAAGAEARSAKSRWAALCKQHGRREAAKMMPEYAARFDSSSQSDEPGKPDALPVSASGTPVAASSSAPSPSPSPSPSPKQEQKPTRKRAPAQTPLPAGFGISGRVTRWAAEKGYSLLDEHLEAFRAKAAAKGYTYADWDSAFMEAIRENWAKLPTGSVALNPNTNLGGIRNANHTNRPLSVVERVRAHVVAAERRDADAVVGHLPAYLVAPDG